MNKTITLKNLRINFRKCFTTVTLLVAFSLSFCQTTWTAIATQAPDKSGGGLILLSDGSVMCKAINSGGDNVGYIWNKLTPDINGSYINGTWSSLAPMEESRLYFSAQTMKDGRIYVAGGEYGTGQSDGEIYDPVANSWTMMPISGGGLYDANSAILDDGRILQASILPSSHQTFIFDPSTNAYTNGPSTIHPHTEATWIKLKDNSILFVGMNTTNSERYIPSLNQWIADANLPVNLYDPYTDETGPSILLPDGRVFCIGSLGNTAIYTPSGNNSPGSWVAGPTVPGNNGCQDAPCAMQVDGKVVFSAGPVPTSLSTSFLAPTYFYEYDYISNSFTQLSSPGGGPTMADTVFNTTMLNLPDGSILMTEAFTKNYYVRKALGAPLAAGKPTITTVGQNGCSNTFSLTGMLFNGISEGASYGDDWQMNTNFPIVRLTSGSDVYYARTFNWNRTGVQTGLLADTTSFALPTTIPIGTYSLYVVANGISSDAVTFTFTPFPALVSPLTAATICTSGTFTYNAVANMTNTTMMWTRAAVSGIANLAITSPQTNNPNELFVNTTNSAKTVVYSYTLTNGSCVTYYPVSVVVMTDQSITITANNNICSNKQATLVAHGVPSYTWNTTATTSAIIVSPGVTTTYTVNGLNYFGCLCTKQYTLNVKPSPTISIMPTQSVCIGDSVVLSAVGNADSYFWNTSQTSNSITVSPGVTTTYTLTSYLIDGCLSSDSVKVIVQACTGIKENELSNFNSLVFPNPFKDKLNILFNAKEAGRYSLKLYDVFGRVVKQEECEFDSGNNKKELVLENLVNGIYLLKVQKDSGIYTLRVLKE